MKLWSEASMWLLPAALWPAAPDHLRARGDAFADTLRQTFGAEAASVYVVNASNANLLELRAKAGYRPDSPPSKRFSEEEALEPHVVGLPAGQVIHANLASLADDLPADLATQIRLRANLLISRHIDRVLAVPMSCNGTMVGTLVVDNPGRDGHRWDDATDKLLLTSIANQIAAMFHMIDVRSIWSEVQSARRSARDERDFAVKVAPSIQKLVHAQAASIFLVDSGQDEQLRYAGGHGYDQNMVEKEGWSYPLTSPKSLTVRAFRSSAPINMTVDRMKQEKIEFSGMCSTYLRTEFRSFLAVSLRDEDNRAFGVIKAENKLGKGSEVAFNDWDEALVVGLIGAEIAPCLRELRATPVLPKKETEGFLLLRAKVGTTKGWMDKILKVERLYLDNRKVVRLEDCYVYMGMPRTTYHRNLKLAQADRDADADVSIVSANNSEGVLRKV